MSIDESMWATLDPQKLETWRELGQKVAVQVEDLSGNKSEGEVFIKNWSKSERIHRALKWGLISWGIAIFCVFIPILHFVLVPLFLIVGPIAAYVMFSEESVVLGGLATCPKCGEKLLIEKAKENWPLQDLCTGCQNSVKINRRITS